MEKPHKRKMSDVQAESEGEKSRASKTTKLSFCPNHVNFASVTHGEPHREDDESGFKRQSEWDVHVLFKSAVRLGQGLPAVLISTSII